MGFSVEFSPDAYKDWSKLEPAIKVRCKKMLLKRPENPRVQSALVSGYDGSIYRLKISSDGFRLVYKVFDDEAVIYIITVGKREDSEVYRKMRKRLGG